MSYLVLARKYRPKTFTEMVGQEHVVQALTNALTQQRLHHAWLFTGTRGVGKTTVSRILAKSLNCQGADGQGGITATPCGVCAACRDIDSGRFPDYTELDAASNRGVDEVQGLLEQAVYKPVQGRFKVFMIDEVHMLTNTAFNAMLKTLEEPPEYLKFVLATTDPQKVPVTVLSRCLQFNLRPMAPETVQAHLVHVLEQERVPADAQALRLLARAARGSMRDALSLADQAIAFGNGQLQEATVRQMLGSADSSAVFQLIDALARSDGKTVVELCDALRSNGLSAAATLEAMTATLQHMAVWQAVPDMVADSSDPDAAETARLAALMPADETQLLYSMCLQGRAELGLAPDEYAGLTMTLLRLLAFKPKAETAEKKTVPPAPEQLISAAPSPTPQLASPPAPPVITPPAAEHSPPEHLTQGRNEDDFWHTTVQQLIGRQAITGTERQLAWQSQLVARHADHWLLRIENDVLLEKTDAHTHLSTALQAAGHTVAQIRVESGAVSDNPMLREAQAKAARLNAAKAVVYADPYVQQLVRDFNAKIVESSIRPLDDTL